MDYDSIMGDDRHGAVQTNKLANTTGQSYRVVVSDNITSCFDTTTYTLTQPALLTVSIVKADVLCKGDATGYLKAIAGGGTVGGGSYIYSWTKTSSSFTSGLNELFNVTAGTYNVTVTDINGCTATASMTITEPAKALTLDSLVGRSTGAPKGKLGNAVAYVSGGTSTYDYHWTTGLSMANFPVDRFSRGSTDSIYSNPRGSGDSVKRGTYSLTVTDANGCKVSGSVFVDDVKCRWVVDYTVDTVLCYGMQTGGIKIGAIDSINYASTSLYTYKLYQNPNIDDTTPPTFNPITQLSSASAWTKVNFTNLYSDQVKGYVYTVRIESSKGCDTLIPVYIKQNPKLSVSDTLIVMPSCYGLSDGEIHVKALGNGLFPPFQYDFKDGNGFISDSFNKNRTHGGPYQLYVKDNHSCYDTFDYKIDTPPRIQTRSVILDTVHCFGDTNGIAKIIVTGDSTKVGNYRYFGKAGMNTDTLSDTILNVMKGQYKTTVTFENLANKKRCSVIDTMNMVEPPMVVLSSAKKDIPCSYDSNGMIRVLVFGGNTSPNFKASLSGKLVRSPKDVDSLSGFISSIDTFKQDTFNQLPEGIYTLTVSDRRGCTEIVTPITLRAPQEFKFGLTPTNASCITVPNGKVEVVSIVGDNLPIANFQWSREDLISGQVTSNFSTSADSICKSKGDNVYGLSKYTLIATDAKGCVATSSTPVDTVYVLRINNIASTVAPCFGGNGTMTVTSMSPAIDPTKYVFTFSRDGIARNDTFITAPKGTYTVTVMDGAGCVTTGMKDIDERPEIKIPGDMYHPKCYNEPSGSIKIKVSGGTPPYRTDSMIWSTTPNQGTDSVTQIKAGNYTVRVTDANRCMKSATFTLVNPPQLIATIDSKKDVTCFAASNGEAEVKVTGGVENFVYEWNKNNDSMPSEKKSKIQNLGPATYRVTVMDNNGCRATASTTVTEPKRLEYDVLDTQEVSCPHYNDGYINIQAKGGIATNAKQYEYSIDGGKNFVTGGKFPSLKAGDYSVVIRDNNGCVAPRKVTVGTPEELFITATKDRYDSLKMGESTTLGFTKLTQSGMIPAITKMSWSEESGLSCSDCESPKASPYVSTLYTIEARYHKNCIAKSSIKVNVKDPLDFFVPNAFTPGNGDGVNDILYVYGNGIKKLRFMIFNRWGEKVFETDHLSKGWDGIYKGELQQSGVYSYSAEVEYLNGDSKNKKGSITLIK